MLSWYLNLLNLIILFGILVFLITLIENIFGRVLMMDLILVGLMGQSLLMFNRHILRHPRRINIQLLNGLLSDMRQVYYCDHLQMILVLLTMFIFLPYLQYQNLILKNVLSLIYHFHVGVLVLMIVFMMMQRQFNISYFVKYVNLFMIWDMMRDCGWWMLKMHIIVYQSKRNIGGIWVLSISV